MPLIGWRSIVHQSDRFVEKWKVCSSRWRRKKNFGFFFFKKNIVATSSPWKGRTPLIGWRSIGHQSDRSVESNVPPRWQTKKRKKRKKEKEKEFRFFSFSLARSRKWIDRPEASVSVKVSRRFDVSDVATPPFFFRLLDVAGSTNRRASSSIRNGGYRSELLRAKKKKEIGGKKTKKKRRRRRRRRGSHSNATVSFSGHFTGFYLVFLHVIDCMGSHRVACCIYRF